MSKELHKHNCGCGWSISATDPKFVKQRVKEHNAICKLNTNTNTDTKAVKKPKLKLDTTKAKLYRTIPKGSMLHCKECKNRWSLQTDKNVSRDLKKPNRSTDLKCPKCSKRKGVYLGKEKVNTIVFFGESDKRYVKKEEPKSLKQLAKETKSKNEIALTEQTEIIDKPEIVDIEIDTGEAETEDMPDSEDELPDMPTEEPESVPELPTPTEGDFSPDDFRDIYFLMYSTVAGATKTMGIDYPKIENANEFKAQGSAMYRLSLRHPEWFKGWMMDVIDISVLLTPFAMPIVAKATQRFKKGDKVDK